MQVKVGTFTKTLALATASQAITGVGFRPKALLLWSGAERNAAVQTDSVQASLGMAVTGIAQSAAAAFLSGEGIVENGQRVSTTTVFELIGNAGGVLSSATLSSFDDDGFTLSWTTNAPTEANEIHYLALAGEELTDVAQLDWTMPTGAGNKAVTGAGFIPDCVIHVHAGAVTATTGTEAQLGIGVMDGIAEWAMTFSADDVGVANHVSSRGQAADACIVEIDPAAQTEDARAVFVSMDADGFTVNFTNAPASAHRVLSLCLKGGAYKVGSFAKDTGAAPDSQSVTGIGFTPYGLLLGSYGADGSSDVLTDAARMGLGLSDGADDGAAGVDDEDGAQNFPLGYSRNNRALTYLAGPKPPTIVSAEVAAFASDQFDLIWRQNTADADEILYLAFGSAQAISADVANVVVTAHGDKCNAGEATLPYLDVCWDQVAPVDDEAFQQYNVYRREAGTTDWTRIATVTPGINLFNAIMALNPAGYWRMGEAVGDILDQTSHGNDGTVTLGAGARNEPDLWPFGTDGSMEFDGADTKVQIADAAALQNIFDDGGAAFFCFNVDSDGEGSEGRIFDKSKPVLKVRDEAGTNVRLEFEYFFSGTNGRWQTAINIPKDTTIIVVPVYDAGNVANNPTLYLWDGSSPSTRTVDDGLTEVSTPVGIRTTDAGSALAIGNNPASTRTFDGHIDESAVFDNPLTAEQAKELITAAIMDNVASCYRDYNARSYQTYEYTVTWTASILGGLQESTKVSPFSNGLDEGFLQTDSAIARVDFDHVFVHEVGDAADHNVLFHSLDATVRRIQERVVAEQWGNERPSAFVGEGDHHTIRLQGLADLHRGPVWDGIADLQSQKATLFVRLGYSGEGFFSHVTRLGRDNAQETYDPGVELTETDFDEAV
ncbi:hypothetical protein LCGC14_1161500 [marine sediment metagenome]|uniref:Uncharacterized protein n=1 Tax=marine sediment metagenome TaxID=412755 RepID=A0A0F9LXH5_9ZZZZ